MIVTDGEDDSAQTASFQSEEKVFPARRTFPIGHLHSEHLAPALPINADGHKHRAGANHRVLAHLLIAGVQDQIGIFTVKLPTRETPELRVQLLIESTDRACAKTVPTELFTNRFDLSGRYPLDIHLR